MRKKKTELIGKLILLAALCAAVRVSVSLGADEAALSAVRAAAQSEKTVETLFCLGLGAGINAARTKVPSDEEKPAEALPPSPSRSPEAEPSPAPAEEPQALPPTSGGTAESICFKNETDYSVNAADLLASPLGILTEGKSRVLIIHTHGSEAFSQTDGLTYEESDPWRTEDTSRSVVALGDAVAQKLTERGVSVLHDTELYDYPSYAGSYNRAAESICWYLEKYPDVGVVLDIHRDALMDSDGTVYKTTAEVNGKKCAQVLVLSGTDFSGLEHPQWRENLKLAVRLQAAMNEKYPGLARPVTVSRYRYNQQLTQGSLIIEIGCNGNSLTEALAAAEYFADCAADVLATDDG